MHSLYQILRCALLYSITAHRGSSQVAASFEATGNGFVQDKDGNVLLRVLDGGKKGQVSSILGSSGWSWNHYEGTTMPSKSTKIEMPLGKELAIRYDIVTSMVEVYVTCDGIQQMLFQGTNKAEVGVFVLERFVSENILWTTCSQTGTIATHLNYVP